MQEIHFKLRGNRGKRGNNEFINRKINEKDHFRIRKSSTKFHIKIRKTHFKIRKWNFKKVLFKNDKSKKVLEIDVEKGGGIFFSIKFFGLIWIILLKSYDKIDSKQKIYQKKVTFIDLRGDTIFFMKICVKISGQKDVRKQ